MARKRDRNHRTPTPGQRAGMVRGYWTVRDVTEIEPGKYSVTGTVMDSLDASTPATFMPFSSLGWYAGRIETVTGIYVFDGTNYHAVTTVARGTGETLEFLDPTSSGGATPLLCIPVLSRYLDLANGLRINGGRFPLTPA